MKIMGLFGGLGKALEATVKVVSTPLAIASDVVAIATGEESGNTSKLLESAGDSAIKSMDKLTGNDF